MGRWATGPRRRPCPARRTAAGTARPRTRPRPGMREPHRHRRPAGPRPTGTAAGGTGSTACRREPLTARRSGTAAPSKRRRFAVSGGSAVDAGTHRQGEGDRGQRWLRRRNRGPRRSCRGGGCVARRGLTGNPAPCIDSGPRLTTPDWEIFLAAPALPRRSRQAGDPRTGNDATPDRPGTTGNFPGSINRSGRPGMTPRSPRGRADRTEPATGPGMPARPDPPRLDARHTRRGEGRGAAEAPPLRRPRQNPTAPLARRTPRPWGKARRYPARLPTQYYISAIILVYLQYLSVTQS